MQFSIIVPVYNVSRYLKTCLDSILAQSYRDYEVILVDDGSTDGSGELCDRYEEQYEAIQVIHQPNKGLSGARNTGLDHAEGEWIVFVDSDDQVEPGMLELLHNQINRYPADLYSFNARKVNEQGETTGNLLYVVENETVVFFCERDRFSFFFERFMQYQTGWEVWSRIYRRNLIEKHMLRFISTGEVFAEDYLFTFQYLLYAKRLRFLCNICYNYLQRSSSLLGMLDSESVLPRLENLGIHDYESVCRAGLLQFRKAYDKLYFMLFNYHLQHLLENLPTETVQAWMWSSERKKKHRHWLRKMKKHRSDLEKYMVKVIWL